MNRHETVRERRNLRVMRERCAALQLLAWTCDTDGHAICEPDGPADALPWLQSEWLIAHIRATAANSIKSGKAVMQPLEGCWVLAVRRRETGLRPSDITVAIALSADFHHADLGESWSQDEAQAIKAALKPFITPDEPRIAAMLDILKSWQDDSEEIDDYAMATTDLSKQLADVYEQLAAIYDIGRSMNNLTNPEAFVRMTCAHVLELLRFNWIAVQYANTPLALPECRGQLLLEGTLPCKRLDFMEQVHRFVESWSGGSRGPLLAPTDNEIAAMVGSEIVAAPIVHDDQIIGALLVGSKRGSDPAVSSHDTQLLDVITDFLGVFHQNVARFESQRSLFMGTVRALTSSIDAKDPYTRGHSDRVAHLSAQLAKAMGIPSEQVERVYIAGIVHDVGKIGVPESTLRKPGRLTDEEFDQIKQHPRIGYDILKDIPPMADVLPGVLHHHERWDGAGYPDGLAGEAIPMFGRLIAVADAFDAMSSTRSYRSAMPREKVLTVLRNGAGTQWDPRMIDTFLSMDLRGFDAIIASQVRRAA